MKRRVVVTGMSGLSPLGTGWKAVREGLLAGRSAVKRVDAWDEIDSLRTRLGAPIEDFVPPENWPRKKTRSNPRSKPVADEPTKIFDAQSRHCASSIS